MAFGRCMRRFPDRRTTAPSRFDNERRPTLGLNQSKSSEESADNSDPDSSLVACCLLCAEESATPGALTLNA